jgi:hypothetical protein
MNVWMDGNKRKGGEAGKHPQNMWGDVNRDGNADWKDDALGFLVIEQWMDRQTWLREAQGWEESAYGSDTTGCGGLAAITLAALFILFVCRLTLMGR